MFTADSATSGREVYKMASGNFGVRLINDTLPGPGGQTVTTTFANLANGEVFACLDDGVDGIEPSATTTNLPIFRMFANLETDSAGSASSNPTLVGTVDGAYLFAATTIASGRELWRSDGTVAGTAIVANGVQGGGSADPFRGVRLGNWVYYSANFTSQGRELCRSDGNVIQLVRNLSSGDASPTELTIFRDRVWFLADDGTGRRLFVTDGSSAGTVAWPISANITELASLRATTTHLFMTALELNTGIEVWATDGVGSVTRITDLNGPYDGVLADPTCIAVHDDAYYFAAYDNTLRATDASALWLIYVPGLPFLPPKRFGVSADLLWFSASGPGVSAAYSTFNYSPIGGWREFIGFNGSRDFTEVGDETLFVRDVPNFLGGIDQSLIASDGTTWNTRVLLNRLVATPGGRTSLDRLHSAGNGNRALFRSAPEYPVGSLGDSEPWISDGSTPGTRRLADLNPGSGGSNPSDFASAGNHVFFSATSPTLGRELWVLPISQLNGTVREVFGVGCAGSRGIPRILPRSQPELGTASFRVEVMNGMPLAPAYLFMGLRQDVPIGLCELNVMTVNATVFNTVTSASGSASVSIRIPNDPNLAGVELFEQWLVLENGASLLGLFAVSDCLRFRIDVQ